MNLINRPEGATHWDPQDCNWLKQVHGTCLGWLTDHGWAKKGWQYPDDLSEMNRLIPVPLWNGEGLPPVGTVCEMSSAGKAWFEVCVKFIGESLVIISTGSHERCLERNILHFRPIRTPEQIAAEERDLEVQEVFRVLSGADNDLCRRPCLSSMAEALVMAGYRKQVTP